MEGKSRQQVVKAAGSITSTIKNKTMNAYSAHFLFCIQSWTSAQGMGPLTMDSTQLKTGNLSKACPQAPLT